MRNPSWNALKGHVWGIARSGPLLLGLLVVLSLAGCSDILSIDDRGVVTEDDLQGADGISNAVGRALIDFSGGFNGDGGQGGARTVGLITGTGLLTDEYIDAGARPEKIEIDARRVTPTNSEVNWLYSNLHRGRVSTDFAEELIAEHGDPNNPRRSHLRSLNAFTFVFLGEAFCSGIPFSESEGGQLTLGEPLTTTEVFEVALERFDQALDLAAATGSGDYEHLARIGKARALVDLGRVSEAAELVESVPTSFAFVLELNGVEDRQINEPWSLTVWNPRLSVANEKGGNGLAYHDNEDPRLPGDWLGQTGFDQATPVYAQYKYEAGDTDLPIAEGTEARLIEAEAALAAGARGEFFDIHNDLRTTVGLEPLEDTGQSEEELVDLHFSERGLWLWNTGHRLGDMRRLIRDYGRSAETVFPSGSYWKGGQYGDAVNFPVPIEERNNPNFDGCFDRDA